MTAVDTNILVYSHREDSAFHQPALSTITVLAEGTLLWGIPWPCVHEFLAIVTHPRIYSPPTPVEDALIQVDRWLESPVLQLLGEQTMSYWRRFRHAVVAGSVTGPRIHDARIAVICLQHGVDPLLTADRDFSRFPDLTCHNPLTASA